MKRVPTIAAAVALVAAAALAGLVVVRARGVSASASPAAPRAVKSAVDDPGRAALDRATSTHDPAEAARWLTIGANAGSAQAAFLLGNAYRQGAGVPQSNAKALAYYERAAEHEHAPALQTLALAYLHGELGLEPDEDASRRYAMEAEHAVATSRSVTPR